MNRVVADASADLGDDIFVRTTGSVAFVSINRPAKRNAITLSMWNAIPGVFESLDRNPDVRAIILSGAEGNFSAGADITEFSTVRATPEQAIHYEMAVDKCCDAIMNCQKPTLAVVDGFCMGGGCHLAMSCDFRFVGTSAVFGIPAARVAIVYGVTATKKLLSLVGVSRAKWILFSGEHFKAEMAVQIGFADELSNDAMGTATAFAEMLSRNAPLSIKGAKALLNALSTGDGRLKEGDADCLIGAAIRSDDYREGRAAFMEKRSPIFKGC